ncbi:MAG: NAD(P)-dependent oxidoreductase [Deltaproteobacteria bacterium]|nr:NAD(P)-dependent oxidoreductase [Deltaproteobacteria bacterium]
MSVLITGGTGFVGIHVTAQLAALGEAVVALSAEGALDGASLDFLGRGRERVTCLKGDVLDLDAVRAVMERHGVDRVIHGAAVTAIGDLEPEAARQAAVVNVGGTATVLEAARLTGVKRFVHLSSASVYGATDPAVPLEEDATLVPRGIYGITKRAAEDVVRRYFELFPMEGAILRLSAPYGPLERPNPLRTVMSPVFHWCRAALEGDEVELADDLVRDLTYVSDTARCVVLAFLKADLKRQVYNASCGENLRFSDILAALARIRPGFRFRLKEGGALSAFFRDSLRGPLSMKRAREDLGFTPQFDIETGLSRYLEWLERHPI